VQLILV